MTKAMAVVDEEIRGECELSIPNEYCNSETVKLSDLFTTIGSCFVYVQESMTGSSNLKVTCTLLERIEFEDSE